MGEFHDACLRLGPEGGSRMSEVYKVDGTNRRKRVDPTLQASSEFGRVRP